MAISAENPGAHLSVEMLVNQDLEPILFLPHLNLNFAHCFSL